MSTELPSSTSEDATHETLFSAPEPIGEESDTESVRSALEQNDALGGDEEGTLTDDDALSDNGAVTTGDSASGTMDTGAIIREE
ncbi:hypothetical protein [Planctomonas deserti]|uniref:hypothetical protein n=1 Tax=Planctomonas deserti TaxID=2144185 RepID=UPI000D3B6A67|nr:hypothetical protein [Planctomonas deserti]